MRFFSTRARHVFHIARWWWALIYTGAWSAISIAETMVAHYGSDTVKAAYNRAWLAPRWGWKVWIIGILVITLFCIVEGSYRHTQALQAKLDGMPRLAYKGISFHDNSIATAELSGSPLVPTGRMIVIGRPTFYHVRIANEPTGIVNRAIAQQVAARVQMFHENGTAAAAERLHRWEDSPEVQQVQKQADRLLPLDIPPSGVEYKLDIAMKYDGDDCFYTPNNETVINGSRDWREHDFAFPPGVYLARVHLQGANVSTEMRFQIVNKGKGPKLEITPLGD